MLPPLDAPHHLRKHEWEQYREGNIKVSYASNEISINPQLLTTSLKIPFESSNTLQEVGVEKYESSYYLSLL